MKLQRYEVDGHAYAGEWCKSEDVERLEASHAELLEALRDMYSGWRYIRKHHGDLYGVGWERCDKKARAAIAKAKGEVQP